VFHVKHVPPPDKERVVISKHWNLPQITTAIRYSHLGSHINLEIGVQDFARAIIHEIGRERWTLWQANLEDSAAAAATRVIEKMKRDHGHEVLSL
jgi:hypothetical protein